MGEEFRTHHHARPIAGQQDMEDLRLNGNELEKIINTEFHEFFEKFRNRSLERRIQLMTKTYGL